MNRRDLLAGVAAGGLANAFSLRNAEAALMRNFVIPFNGYPRPPSGYGYAYWTDANGINQAVIITDSNGLYRPILVRLP
jgi:hypothetical protein